MLVIWSSRGSYSTLEYSFSGEVITATLDGKTDSWDFTGLPDGEAVEITSSLDPCPILSAKRVDGQLQLTLLKLHGSDAPYEDRFPEPEVIGDG